MNCDLLAALYFDFEEVLDDADGAADETFDQKALNDHQQIEVQEEDHDYQMSDEREVLHEEGHEILDDLEMVREISAEKVADESLDLDYHSKD